MACKIMRKKDVNKKKKKTGALNGKMKGKKKIKLPEKKGGGASGGMSA